MTTLLWLIIGGLVLTLGVVLLRRLPGTRAAAVVVLIAAAVLAGLRMFPLAIPLVIFGYGLWRRGGGLDTIPGGRQNSEVRSPGLAMTLDHDSGEMEGEVLTGPFAGAQLATLTPADLGSLRQYFDQQGDTDSLSLLDAYLDRRPDVTSGPMPGADAPSDAPPASPGAMTEAEAYRLLGLTPGASREEVREAHHRLIRRLHPDLGGSSALTAMINAAKDLLDP